MRLPIAKKLESKGIESPISHISSPWGGLNVFSLSPNIVCVEKAQTSLISCLEKYGLDVIPVSYRHMYTMLGCLHCSTLDLYRESELIDYCS